MKYVCTGQCLVGPCPFDQCIRKGSSKGTPKDLLSTHMQISASHIHNGSDVPKDNIGLAADIGTTTVVVGLYDMESGAAIDQKSALNAQCVYGVDVISRIQLCQEDSKGTEKLHTLIVQQINALTQELVQSNGIDISAIKAAVITGNTVMLHTLAGLSPASMGKAPHEAQSLMGKEVPASAIDIQVPVPIYLPPCISAFVGADITCGMVDLDFAKGGSKMMVDIGTNGEIVLETQDTIVATATAAGPAFEAVNISCGMPAFAGAIDSVFIVAGEVHTTTLDDVPAKGICGSGLIDAIAVFLQAGAIDETGAIAESAKNYIHVDGIPALRLTKDVYLTQRDIREFQTAKAAIRAGIETLLNYFSMDADDLDVLYLSGGFGEHIARGSASAVGLIPKVRKIQRCGNTALTGAIRLFHESCRGQAAELAAKTECLNLSTSLFFQDQYVESMMFD